MSYKCSHLLLTVTAFSKVKVFGTCNTVPGQISMGIRQHQPWHLAGKPDFNQKAWANKQT